MVRFDLKCEAIANLETAKAFEKSMKVHTYLHYLLQINFPRVLHLERTHPYAFLVIVLLTSLI